MTNNQTWQERIEGMRALEPEVVEDYLTPQGREVVLSRNAARWTTNDTIDRLIPIIAEEIEKARIQGIDECQTEITYNFEEIIERLDKLKTMTNHNPGSPEAIAQGCVCPRMDNENGNCEPYCIYRLDCEYHKDINE